MREARKRFRMRARTQHFALRRVVNLALHQLIDQRGNLGVPSRCRQRAQFEPQRCRIQSRFLLELREAGQCIDGLSSFERNLRFEHQSRHGETRCTRFRPSKRRFDGVKVSGLQRRARRDQRPDRRRSRDRERLVGELSRLAVPPLDQRHDGGVLLCPRAADLPPAAMVANIAWKPG